MDHQSLHGASVNNGVNGRNRDRYHPVNGTQRLYPSDSFVMSGEVCPPNMSRLHPVDRTQRPSSSDPFVISGEVRPPNMSRLHPVNRTRRSSPSDSFVMSGEVRPPNMSRLYPANSGIGRQHQSGALNGGVEERERSRVLPISDRTEERSGAIVASGAAQPLTPRAQAPPPARQRSICKCLLEFLDQNPLTEAEIKKLPSVIQTILKIQDFTFADTINLRGVGPLPTQCFQLAAMWVQVSLMKCLPIAFLTSYERSVVTFSMAMRKYPSVTLDHVAGAHTLLQTWEYQLEDIGALDEEEKEEIMKRLRPKLSSVLKPNRVVAVVP